MAQTKFQALKEPLGYEMKRSLINNSQTLSVGEVVIPAIATDTSCLSTGGGTVGHLLGVVTSIVGKDGKVLEKDSHAAAADNVTVDMVQANYVPLVYPREFIGGLDADAETTDNSSAFGRFAVDSTGLLVDESTIAAFGVETDKQLFSFGLIPGTTRDVTLIFTAVLTGWVSS